MIDLYHGDCLEEMENIPSGSVDMVLTDPPYGTTACKWDSIIPLEPMWEQLKRVIKPNGAIVMTASQPFTTKLISSNYKMFKYCWVWDKVLHSNPLIAKKQPLNAHEDIAVFYQKQVIYNPQMVNGDKSLTRKGQSSHKTGTKGATDHHISRNKSGMRYPKRIITIPNTSRGGLHPTQKPVALMEYLIKTYTNEGETVLDFAMGSGTSGLASKNLGRSFIGIEKDDKYFEIARDRI